MLFTMLNQHRQSPGGWTDLNNGHKMVAAVVLAFHSNHGHTCILRFPDIAHSKIKNKKFFPSNLHLMPMLYTLCLGWETRTMGATRWSKSLN